MGLRDMWQGRNAEQHWRDGEEPRNDAERALYEKWAAEDAAIMEHVEEELRQVQAAEREEERQEAEREPWGGAVPDGATALEAAEGYRGWLTANGGADYMIRDADQFIAEHGAGQQTEAEAG